MRGIKAILLVLVIGAMLLCACAPGQTENSGSDSTSDPYVGFNDWTQELELEIKRAYWQLSDPDLTGFKAEEVPMYYFGTYSGYAAVLPDGLANDISLEKSIGGHLFKYGKSNVILMFKDGVFSDLEDVVHEGKITQDDVDRIYEKYLSTKGSAQPAEETAEFLE